MSLAAYSNLLRWTLCIEAGLLLVGVLVIFWRAAWANWIRRRYGAQKEAARRALALALTAEGTALVAAEAAAIARLSVLPRHLQLELVVEFARPLTGTQRAHLVQLAAALKLPENARRLAQSRLWGRRVRGVRFLALFGGGEADIRILMADKHPVIRAQAAIAAADSPALVNLLLTLLNDRSGLCRFAAQNALMAIGEKASSALRPLLDGRRPEVQEALAVAIQLASLDFIEPALTLSQHQSHRVRAPAACLLGKIGGAEATRRLTELLSDSAVEVQTAAVRALADLGHWPAAAVVARLLRDREWRVRRESGFALLRLGSPGRLLLERYCHDADRYAAAMAMHVLDVARYGAVA